MGRNKLARIIVASTAAIVAAVLLIHFAPWKATPPGEIYTLTTYVSPSGAGSVSPSGGEYKSGAQIILTASPASGYAFDHWSGSASGTSSTVTIIMGSDKSLTANFKASTQTYTLSTNVSPSGAGSVSPSGGEYESGVQVALTASPASGYAFDYWSGSASSTVSTITITMDSDKSLTASFKEAQNLDPFTVELSGLISFLPENIAGFYLSESGVATRVIASYPTEEAWGLYLSADQAEKVKAILVLMDRSEVEYQGTLSLPSPPTTVEELVREKLDSLVDIARPTMYFYWDDKIRKDWRSAYSFCPTIVRLIDDDVIDSSECSGTVPGYFSDSLHQKFDYEENVVSVNATRGFISLYSNALYSSRIPNAQERASTIADSAIHVAVELLTKS